MPASRIALLLVLAAQAQCFSEAPRSRTTRTTLLVATQPPLGDAPAWSAAAVAVEDDTDHDSTEDAEIETVPPPPPTPPTQRPRFDVRQAARMAIGGGLSGWLAGVVQVICLMWLRTAMNYQYRYGTSTLAALRTLYAQGGIARFYRGVGWALLQTPLSRFGDAAANSGVRELLSHTALPEAMCTACSGLTASLWRVFLTPLDTLKTTLQVEGSGAYSLLLDKVKKHGIKELYAGSLATLAASFIGSYPWFMTFNSLDKALPRPPPASYTKKILRSAALGVSATCVSDTVANSLRVIKTTKQTSAAAISYLQAARLIITTDGWAGLLFRGLSTRLLTNAIQASVFTIVWKLVEEHLTRTEPAPTIASTSSTINSEMGESDSAACADSLATPIPDGEEEDE